LALPATKDDSTDCTTAVTAALGKAAPKRVAFFFRAESLQDVPL
jgi:hypothetical protein